MTLVVKHNSVLINLITECRVTGHTFGHTYNGWAVENEGTCTLFSCLKSQGSLFVVKPTMTIRTP